MQHLTADTASLTEEGGVAFSLKDGEKVVTIFSVSAAALAMIERMRKSASIRFSTNTNPAFHLFRRSALPQTAATFTFRGSAQ